MNIYIDESGSFVSATRRDSWNVVAAVAAAESARRDVQRSIFDLRASVGSAPGGEIKLDQLSESQYLDFLDSLRETELAVFATATDAGLNALALVRQHQRTQVANIRKNISRMKFEGGRKGVALLADQMEALSPQLYVQLICQVSLLHDITKRAITYFVQRIPATLREIRWRIDQKNTTKTSYEHAFEKIAPALLQTRSFEDPMIRVREFDYSHFQRYEFEDGQMPDYLQTEYGLPKMDCVNVQKLVRGNLKFEDSQTSIGIQAADLVASGIRRLLRGGFERSEAVARAIGRLTVQNQRGRMSIELISLSDAVNASGRVSELVRIISLNSRRMLAKSPTPRAAS